MNFTPSLSIYKYKNTHSSETWRVLGGLSASVCSDNWSEGRSKKEEESARLKSRSRLQLRLANCGSLLCSLGKSVDHHDHHRLLLSGSCSAVFGSATSDVDSSIVSSFVWYVYFASFFCVCFLGKWMFLCSQLLSSACFRMGVFLFQIVSAERLLGIEQIINVLVEIGRNIVLLSKTAWIYCFSSLLYSFLVSIWVKIYVEILCFNFGAQFLWYSLPILGPLICRDFFLDSSEVFSQLYSCTVISKLKIIYGLRCTFHGRCGRWRTSLETHEIIL